MPQNSKMAALICIFDLFNLYNSIDLDPDPILKFCDVIKSRGIPQISRDFRGNPGTTWHHMAPSRTSCTSWHLMAHTWYLMAPHIWAPHGKSYQSWHHTFGHLTSLAPHTWYLIGTTCVAPHILGQFGHLDLDLIYICDLINIYISVT